MMSAVSELQRFLVAASSEGGDPARGSSSVNREAFRELCGRLDIARQDSDAIFEDLDQDRDGRISFQDFSKGFADFVATVQPTGEAEEAGAAAEGGGARHHDVWTALTAEAERAGNKRSNEGKLRWLLGELQRSEQRHLVPFLESAVGELLSSVRQLQEEKRQLEESWKREKLEHERHLRRMEEELDSQVKEAEIRLRLKAQAEVEEERKSLQSKMAVEMDSLQTQLQLVEKVDSWLQSQPRDCPQLEEVRAKLAEAGHENRSLRMTLRDSQTNAVLLRGDMIQLRTLYEEKCRELTSERERNSEMMHEQDHLSRQLNLLHDVNRRLLDSHDALRSSAESSPVKKNVEMLNGTPRCKSGSIIGDYMDYGLTSPSFLDRFQENDDDVGPLRRAHSMDISLSSVQRRSSNNNLDSVRESLNQSDSGVSTVRDSSEMEDQWDLSPRTRDDENESVDESKDWNRPRSFPQQNGDANNNDRQTCSKNDATDHRLRASVSHSCLLREVDALPRRKISDIKRQLGIEDKPTSWSRTWSPHPRKVASEPSTPDSAQASSRGAVPPTPLPRASKMAPSDAEQSHQVGGGPGWCEESVEFEPSGPAEQTFKVVFVGDSSVGKTSFALRISKGVFVRHMSSTIGVDFLMRTIRVDGRNVAVQLWDTAGQERFRSLAKSYFRKADGVMLLYDCTCEQSFLSVRQWVEDVDKSSTQRIPLMIVANKTDLRESALQSGVTCIATSEGERLAKDCDTTFMEASAKDGSNVLHALANLIRSMSNHQELQLSASTMHLCDEQPKKTTGCCSK